jgi:predicted small lipoprotein YifL
MKRILACLLALVMVFALVACGQEPAPSTQPSASVQATDPKPTEPAPTEPAPTETEPAPTEPAPRYPDGRISFEAEKPTEKYVDLVDRDDMGGNPMYQPGNQPHSARKIAEDGLQYCVRSTEKIVFCTYDWYVYAFEVAEAGTYVFGVLGSCDRDTPIVVYVDGAEVAAGTGIFNDDVEGHGTDNYSRYDDSDLITLELSAGTHTIKVAIEELKNHNFWVDCYWLKRAE